jgi:uncharacterized membrane protein YdjX (TVP38/TMEM64 family)
MEAVIMKIVNRKNAATLLLVSFLAGCLIWCGSMGIFCNLTVEGVKSTISSSGAFGPVVYMIMFSVIPSGAVIAIAGGMAFGMLMGTVYTMLGAMIGATTAFFISRLLGRDIAERLTRGRLGKEGGGAGEKGFLYILILRLIPIIPFNVVSFAAGLTNISYRDYFVSTVLGIIPGVIIFCNLGDKALDMGSPKFIMAVGVLASLLVGSFILKKKLTVEEIQRRIKEKR